MIKSTIHFLLVVVMASYGLSTLSAQHQHSFSCGTSLEDQSAMKEKNQLHKRLSPQLIDSYQQLRNQKSGSELIIWVPVAFHLCSKADGTGQHSDTWVLEQLCMLNENFADQDIRFYLYTINRFNNDQMYVNSAPIADYIRSIHRVEDVMNIYVGGPTAPGSGYGAYYSGAPGQDWIFTWNDIYSWGLTHEVGHYFQLPHTFYGWEGMDYDTVSAATGQAPVTNAFGHLVEKVARGTSSENCQVAGDGFCDTPPDYASGGGSGCSMPSHWVDPDGVPVPVSPVNPENYMSYFFCNTKEFTLQQKDVIWLDNLSRGNHFNPKPVPVEVSGSPSLVYPNQNSFVPYTAGSVRLNWNAATSSSMYLVTVQQTFNNGQIPGPVIVEKVVFSEEIWINLDPNLEYTWKVQAFTRYDVCPNTNIAEATFTTGDWLVATRAEEAQVFNTTIYPNPSKKADLLFIEIESEIENEVQISIQNALGQVVLPAQQVQASTGTQVHQLDISRLAAGLYFVQVDNGLKAQTHKLIISE